MTIDYKVNVNPSPIKPMLAREMEPLYKNVQFPCYVQPKFDGVRCMVTFLEGRAYALSRNGKTLDLPDHIRGHLETCYRPELEGLTLDGELYIHGLSFQEVLSRVKRVVNGRHPDHASIRYYLYDVVSKKSYGFRYSVLRSLITNAPDLGGLNVVQNDKCSTLLDLDKWHKFHTGNGYEGTMIRDMNVGYETGKRSRSLLKRKDWQEDEFKLVSIEEGKGKNAGTAVLNMVTKTGVIFSSTAPGDYAEKTRWWDNRESLVRMGVMVSVKYQNLTDGGSPRFPEALGVKGDR